MQSKIASRIAISLFCLVIVCTGGVVGASAWGLFTSTPPGITNSDDFVQPLPDPATPAGGIEGLDYSDTFDGGSLQQRLDGHSGSGSIGYAVYDLSGKKVASRASDSAKTPASSFKTLTSLGVLAAYGPQHRFTTRVVSSSQGIIIVGAGDPFLTAGKKFHPWQASAEDLADQVAEALKKSQKTSVVLGYDTSLFAAQQWNPGWNARGDEGFITSITALSIDPKMSTRGNATQEAVNTFSNLLSARGITVTTTQEEKSPENPTTLGEVDSLPLGLIVQRTMEVSHNFAAEVMFYHVAVAAGQQGSYTNAQKAMEAYLKSADLWMDGMSIYDGSGLARGNRVPPAVLAKAVLVSIKNPQLADVVRGMPVAGVEGTLSSRFDDRNEAAGRGVVHAKTGMLTGVRSLTGVVSTQSGHVLVFSFMVNDVTNDYATLNWLDRAASILAES
jgi:D-alanyl-D-alanine carboxypeptidase/D-alanyl-D-alanine-endopeptidase (penicillin-binding protein 4)